MRTTLDIDGELLEKVTQLTGHQNKSKAVCEALREYIQQQKIDRLEIQVKKAEVPAQNYNQASAVSGSSSDSDT